MARGQFQAKAWGSTIVDAASGRLLDIVAGRSAKAPTQWLLGRPRRWLDGIRWGVLDLSGPYRAAFGITNLTNHRTRALLYADKPDRALLDTLTPTQDAKSPIRSPVTAAKNLDARTLASGQNDSKGLCHYTPCLC